MQIGVPEVLYEDNHLIFVNKPHGWLVHGDKTQDATLGDWIKDYLKVKYNKPGEVFLGIVHRLDRPVGGVMVFARTSKSLVRMNKIFSSREVTKEYIALTERAIEPEEGVMKNWLFKNTNSNQVEVADTPINENYKYAESQYWLSGMYKKFYLMKLQPFTGRSHQLRVQLANKACPIVGDLKYGAKQKCIDGNIALKCERLSFTHPVTKVELIVGLDKISWNV